MILIIGSDEDPTTTYFLKFLDEHNTKYIFFDQKFVLNGIDISNNSLQIFGKRYDFSVFSGVLNRMSNPKQDDLHKMPLKFSRCMHLLENIVSIFMANVLNPPFLGISNDSKMFQTYTADLKVIKKPKSFIISNLEVASVLKKISNCQRHIIKSLSSIRSIGTEFETNINLFPKKSKEPVLFQELIEGPNIRVHVIDETCISIIIFSEALDYRYCGSDKRVSHTYELPVDVQKECIAISKKLKLRFCGIDLIKRNGEYYFLEANPSPGWSYFEEMVGHKNISYKLLEVLSGK